ncbi:altered phosphate starvation response 1-like protein [Tanacetum coccineum]
MIVGSHSSTLNRLYAWERKLYDELKGEKCWWAGDGSSKVCPIGSGSVSGIGIGVGMDAGIGVGVGIDAGIGVAIGVSIGGGDCNGGDDLEVWMMMVEIELQHDVLDLHLD